jgi:hypothetical protein
MNAPCIIVNMSGSLDADRFGNEHIIRPNRRPSYVHDDVEAARQEALRLHKKHASAQGRFVIFQAVEVTEWRTPFEIAAETVAVLEPYERPVATITEKPKRRRKKA